LCLLGLIHVLWLFGVTVVEVDVVVVNCVDVVVILVKFCIVCGIFHVDVVYYGKVFVVVVAVARYVDDVAVVVRGFVVCCDDARCC